MFNFKVNNNTSPIVFVDDEEDDLFIFKRAVKKSALNNPVITFNVVDKFLEYINDVKSGFAVSPIIIFIDINMPKYSGLEILQKIRGHDEQINKTKLIVLSTSSFSKDKDKAYAYGCDGFIVKPDDPKILVDILNQLVS
ncbi:MAG: response regulator [Bdellovibrionales bacterium]|nr:response regulator [Bdellovibrionales bacterium]